LPDGKCGTIIRQVIVPAFRNGDYHGGILEAFRIMGGVVAGDSAAIAQIERADQTDNDSPIIALIFFLIVFIAIVITNGWGGRFLGGIGGHSGWSSGGWSGGGGGGGFSGGGGSFGGGGASGGW
nr:TPM domain-containing protein [Candidatus Delongbacteria bacterium]